MSAAAITGCASRQTALREPLAGKTKSCGVCGRAYGTTEWQGLPPVAVVPAAIVRQHLSVSADWVIELKACPCGAVLAARRSGRALGQDGPEGL